MGIDFKGFMSDIKKGAGVVKKSYKDVVKNTYELAKTKQKTKKTNKKTGEMQDKGVIDYAQKRYKKKYGNKMTQSMYNEESKATKQSQQYKDYDGWKKEGREKFDKLGK